MNICEYIKKCIKEEGRTSLWISEKLNVNYKTFVGRLNKNKLSADDLLKISVLLDIDLEEVKNELDYNNLLMNLRKFIYIPINCDKESLLSEDKIPVVEMELRNKEQKDTGVLVNILNDEFNNFEDIKKYKDIKIYAFIENENNQEYELGEVSINLLKNIQKEKNPRYSIEHLMIKQENKDTYLLQSTRKVTSMRGSSGRFKVGQFPISSKVLK